MFVYLVMYHWQLDGEGCTLAKLAFHLDVAIVQVNDLLDICQSESEALHVMHIASVYAIFFKFSFFIPIPVSVMDR